MQGYRTGSVLPNLTLWFGRRTDGAETGHIIGIAIDEPDSGHVRVQTEGKYLPGLYGNLNAGQLYAAGDNGSVVPFTGAAGTKPVGVAVAPDGFLFFGAMQL